MVGWNARRWVVVAWLVCSAGCNVFDSARLLPLADAGANPSDGGSDSGADGSTDGDAGMCVPRDEVCNGLDDDCDGNDDAEDLDTVAYCEGIVVNSVTACRTPQGADGPRCLRLSCLEGWANCDGIPSNGCEAPFCDCNACPDDAGVDDDAGPL